MKKLNIHIPLALTLGLFVIAYIPALRELSILWYHLEEYSHAFLTIPIIFYMVWLKRDELPITQGNISLCAPLVALASIIYFAGLLLISTSLNSLALITTLLSILVYFFGLDVLKKLAMPIILLILLIPIPNQIYSAITVPLQLKVSETSGFIIQLLNIPVFREGNIIHIPTKTFQVIEACSGMRYIISITTLSLIFGYFTLQKTFSKVTLVLLSIPVAFLVNVIRVLTLVLVFHYFRLDWTTGTVHTIMGLVIFGIALLILFLLQRILERWETKKITSGSY